MAKTEVIPFKKFMDGSFKEREKKNYTFDDIVKKLSMKTIAIGGLVIVLTPMLTSLDVSAASLTDYQESITTFANIDPDTVSFSSTSAIDQKGKMLYRKVLNVGKWLIIIKGGWEIIASTVKSDFDKVKKVMVQYLIAYGCLWLFPFVLDEIENFFTTM